MVDKVENVQKRKRRVFYGSVTLEAVSGSKSGMVIPIRAAIAVFQIVLPVFGIEN